MEEPTCAACGSTLPPEAMFCGECGRAVTAAAAAARRVQRSSVPQVSVSAPGAWHWGAGTETGEPEAEVPAAAPATGLPAESVLQQEILLESLAEPEPPADAEPPAEAEPSADAEPPAEPEPRRESPSPEPSSAEPLSGDEDLANDSPSALRCEQCGAELAADDIFCGECGHVSRTASMGFGDAGRSTDTKVPDTEVPDTQALDTQALDTRASPTPAIQPVRSVAEPAAGVPLTAGGDALIAEDATDIEATRIIARHQSGVRFVLQFSTAESCTVYGTGLIGRNPQAEPGEFFDQLVRVLDPSRSVSKSHLEFGQEAGSFWVLDRFSGNGTVLREPDAKAVRCVPGRRYLIPRGTRVEIGEQFFIVS